MSNEIIDGIVTVLWGSAWADHAEDHDCHKLAGCQIEEVMPEPPPEARVLAIKLAADIMLANGCSLDDLYERALLADIAAGTRAASTPEEFGNCLAWEAMGAGVSWTDNHAEFEHKVRSVENYELQLIATDRCKKPSRSSRIPCPECGSYIAPNSKCGNCGHYIAWLPQDGTVN